MDIYSLKNLSHSERMLVLDEATRMEEGRYFQPLTEVEMDYYRRQLADNSIMKSQVEHELNLVKDEYKEKLKPYSTAISEAIEAIKTKQIEKTGRLYILSDFDEKVIHKVDINGNVIQSRPMLPEERQTVLRPLTPLKQINE